MRVPIRGLDRGAHNPRVPTGTAEVRILHPLQKSSNGKELKM